MLDKERKRATCGRCGRLHPEAPMYKYTCRPLARWMITGGGQVVNYAQRGCREVDKHGDAGWIAAPRPADRYVQRLLCTPGIRPLLAGIASLYYCNIRCPPGTILSMLLSIVYIGRGR